MTEKIITNSDEDGDSDSTLEDLTTLLATRIPKNENKRSHKEKSTLNEPSIKPIRLRMKYFDHESCPVEDKTKYKYDLKSLAKSTKIYDATEASSNRVKEMLDSQNKIENQITTSDDSTSNPPKLNPDILLESVEIHDDTMNHNAQRIRCAVERTQTDLEQKRWYFFNSRSKLIKPSNNQFPIASLPKNWKGELRNSQMRISAFISGHVEDMVSLGKVLPDDVVLWLLREICSEEREMLRSSYKNVLIQSSDQMQRLIIPGVITDIFACLNATPVGTNVMQKIELTKKVPGYYSNYDWSSLISSLNFFSLIADTFSNPSRLHLICILLRMSVDTVIFENPDIIYNFQNTVNSLCRSTPANRWEQFVSSLSL